MFSALLVMLILALALVMPVPALAQPPLDGNVEEDFIGSDILIIPDSIGSVGLPTVAPLPPPGTVSGWDVKDLRLCYNATTDIMYIGINVGNDISTILGDADGDGDPGQTSTWLAGHGGTDIADLGSSECAAVFFDLDEDDIWDVIAGISGVTDYSGFSVNRVTSGPFNPALSFGDTLASHKGSISANPDADHPDLEFTITHWSTLPGQDDSPGFCVGASLGAYILDDGIGEDFLQASLSPSIDIKKQVSKDNVNFFDADNAALALDVNADDSVYFKYIVTNTGDVTLTNITLFDDTHDVSGITVTEPLAPQASFQGVIGPITPLSGLRTDVATATGYWGGFTVEDTNPANYSMSPAVGGTAFPVGKLGLLAPWAILLGCAGIVTLLMLRKRRQA